MKQLVFTFLAAAILTACGSAHSSEEITHESDSDGWKVEVYAMMDEDRLALDSMLPREDEGLRKALERTHKTAISDTSRINNMLAASRDALDSLGLKTAWMTYEDSTQLNLVLYRSEPLLTDTVYTLDVSDYSGFAGNVMLAFEFSDKHEWELITRDLVGRRMALSINGEVVNTPLVNAPISGGGCTIVLPFERALKHFPGMVVCMKND